MIESGTGAAAYYADMLYACVVLAVTAPCGPPYNTASFLDRLDAKWLQSAWGDGRHPRQAEQARAAAKHLRDIQLRYATLLDRLGPALDGPGTLDEADAWYFILEGTREPSVAEAQAMAITELAARAATALDGEQRAILLAADDYSAVSRRVPMSNLYERGRSLGIGVQVSAQSWQGLGADEDERYRIAATADGGIFVLNTPHPEPLVALAGTRRVLETAHKLIGNSWGDEGTTREQRAWTADPDIIRRLTVGQACYIHRGAATFVQVARPAASPLTLLPPPAPAPPPPPAPAARAPARSRARRPGRAWMTSSDPETPDDAMPNPFEILGLPARRDLTDEQVDAAWRTIAVATHPDRADGGDLARYTQASAAFAELRTPWSRSEAYADLVEQAWADGYDGLDDDGQPCTEPLPPIPLDQTSLPRGDPVARPSTAAEPDPPRPPAAPSRPRDHRRRAVPAGAEPDPGPARRPRRHPRPDHLVRADRPQGPRTPPRRDNCLRRLEITYPSPACSDDIARAAWSRTAAKLIPVAEAISVSGRSAK